MRYLSGGSEFKPDTPLPVAVLFFFQEILALFFLMPWLFNQDGMRKLKTQHPGWHALRLLMTVGGLYLWYESIHRMHIAEASALSFTGIILTVMGARILLKEDITPKRWLVLLLSMIGTAFIVLDEISHHIHKNFEWKIGLIIMLPILSAMALSGSKLLTRKLAAMGESSAVLTLYYVLFMAPITFFPAYTQWVTPAWTDLPGLFALGAATTFSYFAFNRAYALAEVTYLAPFGFAKYFLGVLFGYLAFSEMPTTSWAWIGIGLSFLSIVLANV
jgi:drug/metabolite transporter (DMT)-like permease